MMIVDAPDISYSSTEEWISFLQEMRRARRLATSQDDLAEADDWIKQALAVLLDRKVAIPPS